MYYDGWSQLVALLVVTATTYLFIVGILRVSGKRTLSKLNAFDLVVTIALGSTLSTAAVSRRVPLTDALLAVTTLVVLQLVVAVAIRRSARVRRIARAAPRALLVNGEPIDPALARERLTRAELGQAVREAGFGGFEGIDVVVLESDGTMTVIADAGSGSALEGVLGAGSHRAGVSP